MYGVDGPFNLTQDGCASRFAEMKYTGLASHAKDVGLIPMSGSKSGKLQVPLAVGLLATQQKPGLGLLGLSEPTECQASGGSFSTSFVSVMEEEVMERNLSWAWSYTAGRYNGQLPLKLMITVETNEIRWIAKHQCKSHLRRLGRISIS